MTETVTELRKHGIRKAGKDETDHLVKIYEEARDFMHRTGNPGQWPGSYPGKKDILKDLENDVLYVTEDGGGVMALIPGPDPTYAWIDGTWPDNGDYWVIHRIAVRPGKGRGTALIRFAKETCDRIRIDTHKDNAPMKNLLRKEGFIYCGTIVCASGGLREAWFWQRIENGDFFG